MKMLSSDAKMICSQDWLNGYNRGYQNAEYPVLDNNDMMNRSQDWECGYHRGYVDAVEENTESD